MQFVLTTFGQDLLNNSGTPLSLAYALGTGVGYTPNELDTNIHGTLVGVGQTLSVAKVANQPTYAIVIDSGSVDVPPFGEVGLFLGVNLVALGVSTVLLHNEAVNGNLSILAILPAVVNSQGFFTPVALSSQSGISFLPSVDALARASNVLEQGFSNLYGFLDTDVIAASAGQRWLIIGVTMLRRTTVVLPVSPGSFSIGSLLPGFPDVGSPYIMSFASGANAGLVRRATLASVASLPSERSTFNLSSPVPGTFVTGDEVTIYAGTLEDQILPTNWPSVDVFSPGGTTAPDFVLTPNENGKRVRSRNISTSDQKFVIGPATLGWADGAVIEIVRHPSSLHNIVVEAAAGETLNLMTATNTVLPDEYCRVSKVTGSTGEWDLHVYRVPLAVPLLGPYIESSSTGDWFAGDNLAKKNSYFRVTDATAFNFTDPLDDVPPGYWFVIKNVGNIGKVPVPITTSLGGTLVVPDGFSAAVIDGGTFTAVKTPVPGAWDIQGDLLKISVVPTARLAGTYNISITGNAATATEAGHAASSDLSTIALSLATNALPVGLNTSNQPTPGQVLTAVSGTVATWQTLPPTPSGSGTSTGTNTGDQVASTVPSTPVGAISATNVQDALAELDAEKAPTANPTFSGVVTVPTPVNATDAATKGYADSIVVGLWDDRGSFSAAGGTFPTSGGSGAAGVILKGDLWQISVAGTLAGSVILNVGDTIRALIDNPGQVAANWATIEGNIGYVPENSANKNASGGYAGLTLFNINLRNTVNTVTSFFTTAATVARTWTFPDKNGTVAMTSDIVGTVSNVSGTAPISVATPTSTPVISIAAATTSAAGSMSSADKTKLNAITGTNTGDQTAATVPSTPTGTIAATTVQAALAELDSEKAALATTLSVGADLNTVVTSGFYRLLSGNLNGPTQMVVDHARLLVVGGTDTLAQIIVTTTAAGSRSFVRGGNPPSVGGLGSWWAWREVIYADNPTFTGTVSGITAGMVGVTPTGTIAATTVQAALAEIALEAQSLVTSGTGTGTLTVTDRGASLHMTGSVTVPSAVFTTRDVVTLVNVSGASQSILQGAGMTLTLINSTSTGTRSLANNSFATVYFVSGSAALISGTGLT